MILQSCINQPQTYKFILQQHNLPNSEGKFFQSFCQFPWLIITFPSKINTSLWIRIFETISNDIHTSSNYRVCLLSQTKSFERNTEILCWKFIEKCLQDQLPWRRGGRTAAEEVMQFRGYQPNPRMPWRVLEMDHHFKSACLEARSLHLWPLYYQPGGLCQHSREMYRFELGSSPQLRAIPEDGVKRVIFPATVYECLSSEG